jgi:hypothetical protein
MAPGHRHRRHRRAETDDAGRRSRHRREAALVRRHHRTRPAHARLVHYGHPGRPGLLGRQNRLCPWIAAASTWIEHTLGKKIGQHSLAPFKPPVPDRPASCSQWDQSGRKAKTNANLENPLQRPEPAGFAPDGCGSRGSSEAQTSELIKSSTHTFHVNGWDTGIRSRVGQGKALYLEKSFRDSSGATRRLCRC